MKHIFKMEELLILLVTMITVSGCNGAANGLGGIGGNGTSIAVQSTSGNCGKMTNGQVCNIVLAYNTNGIKGVALGYTPNPLPAAITNGTFNSTFGTCQMDVSRATTNKQYTCTITITYTSNIGGANLDLVFTLSTAKSKSIKISGN